MGRTAYEDWIDFSVVASKTGTPLCTEKVMVRVTESGNVVTNVSCSTYAYGASIALQWRKESRRYYADRVGLKKWGSPRNPPWWFLSEISLEPNTTMAHRGLARWQADKALEKAGVTYAGKKRLKVRIEPSPAVVELLEGRASRARREDDENAERSRRSEARSEYVSLARKTDKVARRCLESAETPEEAAKAGELIFFARENLKKKKAEALVRWPMDLKEMCVGDAGAIGELALLAEEDES